MKLVSRQPAADALPLEEVLDLHAARPLAESLMTRRGQDLDLDASVVRRLGGLCLQVLLAAEIAWTEDGKTLALLNPSVAFVEALDRLGAQPHA